MVKVLSKTNKAESQDPAKSIKMAGTTNQYITEDYDIFVTLKGNRKLDSKHTKQLQKLMLEKGNLIDKFPIVVNERMEIIDGQHRLAALKELEWPVVYEIREDLNIDNVRTINSAHKNWGWLDYAKSYADLGNENYLRFLNLHNYFGYNFGILMYYIGQNARAGMRPESNFYSGDLRLDESNHQQSYELLKNYQEISQAADFHNREFAKALRDVMRSPDYDQARMVEKMRKYAGNRFESIKGKNNMVREIEVVYNTYAGDADKVRLF